MTERDILASNINRLSGDVNGLREDMKELAKALKELIRIDGDIKRLGDMVLRIGKEASDHETRLRKIESKSGKMMDRLLAHILSTVIGGVVVFIILKTMGN